MGLNDDYGAVDYLFTGETVLLKRAIPIDTPGVDAYKAQSPHIVIGSLAQRKSPTTDSAVS